MGFAFFVSCFLAACALGLLVFLIPTIVAVKRNHPQKVPIIVINILLGGTLVGWAVALVWALAEPEKPAA